MSTQIVVIILFGLLICATLIVIGMNAGVSMYKRYQEKHCVFCTRDLSASYAICFKCRKDMIDGARDTNDIPFDNIIPKPTDNQNNK